ncbi:MAG: pyridoxamine 5'-phosphate oxidase family protein [Actinomycetota bacterium]|nr:pyridoxamine 5'-phosphate oxidase family protein [Actinomycetota bacterium]
MDLPEEVSELFAEEMAAKFLATADARGEINVALIVTLQPPPDGRKDRLIFGEFLMWNSKRNLRENPRVAAAAVNMKLKMATLLGEFRGFEEKGMYKDAIDSSPFMRYNAYSGVRAAGVIDAVKVGPLRKPFLPGLVIDPLRLRMRGAVGENGGVRIPGLVKSKFCKLTSIKALAVLGEDGYPHIYPVLTVAPAGDTGFLLRASKYNRELAGVKVPCRAVMSLVTMDVKSYKVKGELNSLGGDTYHLRVDEVYNSMPPLAGDRIVPRDKEATV